MKMGPVGIRILVVEDEPLFCAAFRQKIVGEPSFNLVATCMSGRRACEVIGTQSIDVALVDMALPDISGIEVIKTIKRMQPDCDVMVISMFGDEDLVLAAIEAGASGYLLKDSLPDEFVRCIQELRAGGAPISPMIARLLLERTKSTAAGSQNTPAACTVASNIAALKLSEREIEILRIVAKGFSISEIAELFSLSPNTVKTYIKRIYQKLAVSSRAEAIYEANHLGLLDSGHTVGS